MVGFDPGQPYELPFGGVLISRVLQHLIRLKCEGGEDDRQYDGESNQPRVDGF